MRERPSHPINRPVFFIPLAVLATALIASLWQGARFLAAETAFNDWILRNFGPMFTISSVLFLALLAAIALSPFGGTIIGGEGAKPWLGRWRRFAGPLRPPIATVILFSGVDTHPRSEGGRGGEREVSKRIMWWVGDIT